MSRITEVYKEQQKIQKNARLNALLSNQYVQKPNEIKLYGNQTTYNLPQLSYQNIIDSYYFHSLLKLEKFEDVVAEGKKNLRDVEPLIVGTAHDPSTSFCILMKFFMYRLTYDELFQLLRMKKCPHLRAIGFLYIRFGIEPKQLWTWLSPYFDEAELFIPSANDKRQITIGEYVENLIRDKTYFGLILPSIPITTLQTWKVQIIQYNAIAGIKRFYEKGSEKKNVFAIGDKVKAFYPLDMKWYDATIKYVNNDDTYIVIYDGYNNTEYKSRGHLLAEGEQLATSSNESDSRHYEDNSKYVSRRERSPISDHHHYDTHHRSNSHHHTHNYHEDDRRTNRHDDRHRERSHSHHRHTHKYDDYDRRNEDHDDSYDRYEHSRSHHHNRSSSSHHSYTPRDVNDIDILDTKKLLNQLKEEETQASLATGHHFCTPVKSYKAMLSLKQDTYTNRKRDSPSPDRYLNRHIESNVSINRTSPSVSPKPSFVPDDNMKQLLNKYGANINDYTTN